MAHDFNAQNDAEASALQQTLASFVSNRANRKADVLMLEGFCAGVINEGSMIRQLHESDIITGARTRTRKEYSQVVSHRRRESSVVELALGFHWPAAGIEQLWVSELHQPALILEDSKPVGTSIRIAYLLVELRNRIALACATEILLKSKQPVIVMGALHAFGLKLIFYSWRRKLAATC